MTLYLHVRQWLRMLYGMKSPQKGIASCQQANVTPLERRLLETLFVGLKQ